MPEMIATNVVISITPFAHDKRRSLTSSGIIPYLLGLKNALCDAIRNMIASAG